MYESLINSINYLINHYENKFYCKRTKLDVNLAHLILIIKVNQNLI